MSQAPSLASSSAVVTSRSTTATPAAASARIVQLRVERPADTAPATAESEPRRRSPAKRFRVVGLAHGAVAVDQQGHVPRPGADGHGGRPALRQVGAALRSRQRPRRPGVAEPSRRRRAATVTRSARRCRRRSRGPSSSARTRRAAGPGRRSRPRRRSTPRSAGSSGRRQPRAPAPARPSAPGARRAERAAAIAASSSPAPRRTAGDQGATRTVAAGRRRPPTSTHAALLIAPPEPATSSHLGPALEFLGGGVRVQTNQRPWKWSSPPTA